VALLPLSGLQVLHVDPWMQSWMLSARRLPKAVFALASVTSWHWQSFDCLIVPARAGHFSPAHALAGDFWHAVAVVQTACSPQNQQAARQARAQHQIVRCALVTTASPARFSPGFACVEQERSATTGEVMWVGCHHLEDQIGHLETVGVVRPHLCLALGLPAERL